MPDFLSLLNSQQREAVTTTARCAVVLAGPGSGKTRALTHRVAYLVKERGVNPTNILAVTFTNKAAGEMGERLAALLTPEQARRVVTRTFHSFGARMLRAEMPRLAPLLSRHLFTTRDRQTEILPKSCLNDNFSIYDDGDQRALVGRILKDDLNLDTKRYKPAEVLGALSRWKNEGILPADPKLVQEAEEDNQLGLYRRIYVLYQASLLTANACDFDDLILYPLLYFRWETTRLRAYQDRFTHILVDEFQDTNGVQYELTDLLSARGHLFVVGDEDQSIYGFRGANFSNVRRLMDAHPEHRLILLEQNYRSAQAIVQAANQLITRNAQRVPKRLWTDNCHAGSLTYETCYSEIFEAETAANLIAAAHADGVPYKEIAVLYRVNAMSRELEAAMLRHKIPYTLLRGTAFYDRAEVKDVLGYLKVICNGDALAFSRIANRPRRGVGEKTVEAIVKAANGDVLAWLLRFYNAGKSVGDKPSAWKNLAGQSGLTVGPGAAQKVWEMARVIAGLYHQVRQGATVLVLIEAIIAGLRPHFEAMDNAAERIENAKELLTVAGRIETPGEAGLREFLDGAALVSAADDIEEDADRVVLGTLHSAKGLEFEVVIIAGVEDGLCPHRRSVTDGADPEEERRLFYVGATRAKQQLHLLWARERTLFGETTSNYPSPYLVEMGLTAG